MKIKWLFFTCALCVFSIGATSIQGAPISPDAQVFIKTAQWGVPAAVIEWAENQLLEDEGIYSFTGRSPVPFTGLSVGWLATDNNIGAKEFEVAIRTRIDEGTWTEWVRNPKRFRKYERECKLVFNQIFASFKFINGGKQK